MLELAVGLRDPELLGQVGELLRLAVGELLDLVDRDGPPGALEEPASQSLRPVVDDHGEHAVDLLDRRLAPPCSTIGGSDHVKHLLPKGRHSRRDPGFVSIEADGWGPRCLRPAQESRF